ncbi:MAG: endonuclease/exonuclease/phosphatase family protein [Alphaproteobacteria bacterium]|nr:endonuclease/exonuclease/phosphatase family protein [Alphaproteobacteria bacterium]
MFHGNISPAIAGGLKILQARIEAAKIPPSKLDETLNIATWNVREFGKKRRSEAAIHYIAEVLGQFDLIGLVELRDNLEDLGRVLPILGPYWRAVYSDAIPDPGGNRERIAFLYDKRAVVFNGLAAEASPPRKKKGAEYLPDKSFWRAPYIASFKSGDFDFVVLTTHVRWSTPDDRVGELELLANWIEAKRQEKTKEDKDLIVMGDFNIPARNDRFFKAITQHGLQIPTALLGLQHGSNLAKDKRYDQILHDAIYPENFSRAGGVLDFYDGNHKALFPDLTKEQFTFQMSDHLPLWLQIDTDIDGRRLDQIIQG